jgi:putative ABC transport system permease protein
MMTAPWCKAVRDVWRERTRAVLVMLAIAVGITAFLAVLSSYGVLRRELNRGYLATNPASAVLTTDAIDDRLLAMVRGRADVAEVDARRVVTARIKTPAGEWRRIVLFVIRDFNALRVSTVTPEHGTWPPQRGELLIERDAFQVAQARRGDTVTIRIASGAEHALRVAGGVHDAGQAQARMENQVYGYVTLDTLALLGEPRILDRLYLIAGGDRFDRAHVQRVASDVKEWLESVGHRVTRMDVPQPGQHPHAAIMGLLLLVMALFGFLALVLSGVIVVNLLMTIMAAERRQIGVMKAVGGSRAQIARIYVSESALFGVGALALGVPAGLATGRALTRYLAVLLNFDVTSVGVPVWVYLLVAVVGLLVPIGAAVYPVAVATDVSVYAALSPIGIDPGTFGSRVLDRWMCDVGGIARPLLLGVRNSVRRPMRTVFTLGTLSVAGAFFMSALNLRASMMAAIDRLVGAGTINASARYAWDQHMLMIYAFLMIVAGLLAIVGGLGLMTTTSLSVLERRRELGVLRAIGAAPATVAGIVFVENVFVTLVSWVLALVAAWAIAAGAERAIGSVLFRGSFGVAVAPAGVLAWLVVSGALATLASLGPAFTTSRRSIREAISYE